MLVHEADNSLRSGPAKKEIELDVDASVIPSLQKDLENRRAGNISRYGVFDHKPGPDAVLRQRFFWKDNGVYLEVAWTDAGKRAVKGPNDSYFSPSFFLADNKIVGLLQNGSIGALTNNPAFRDIMRSKSKTDQAAVK